jgi:dihydroneopterin aldolase
MTAFLASTRDLAEAKIALIAGADWIDMKEPRTGALGAVAPGEVARVVAWLRDVDENMPVSATIGDCWSEPAGMPARVATLAETGVPYVKIGVYAAQPGREMLQAVSACCAYGPRIILVCFAEAPPDATSITACAATGIHGMMLDTADKHSGALTSILAPSQIARFVDHVQRCDLLCGLAGSLGLEDIRPLLPLGADYLGFRGALCDAGGRAGMVSAAAVATIRHGIDSAQAEITEHLTMEGRARGMA